MKKSSIKKLKSYYFKYYDNIIKNKYNISRLNFSLKSISLNNGFTSKSKEKFRKIITFNFYKKRDKFLRLRNRYSNEPLSSQINNTVQFDSYPLKTLLEIIKTACSFNRRVIFFYDLSIHSEETQSIVRDKLVNLFNVFPTDIYLLLTYFPGFISNKVNKDLNFIVPKFSIFVFLNFDLSISLHNVMVRELINCMYDYVLFTRETEVDIFKMRPLVLVPLNVLNPLEFDFFALVFTTSFYSDKSFKPYVSKFYLLSDEKLNGVKPIYVTPILMMYCIFLLRHPQILNVFKQNLKITTIKRSDWIIILNKSNRFKTYVFKKFKKIKYSADLLKYESFYRSLIIKMTSHLFKESLLLVIKHFKPIVKIQ